MNITENLEKVERCQPHHPKAIIYKRSLLSFFFLGVDISRSRYVNNLVNCYQRPASGDRVLNKNKVLALSTPSA